MQEEFIYHYTDINALKSILTNQKLWMTSHEFLNDTEEFDDGFNRLNTVLTSTLAEPSLTDATKDALNHMLELLNNTLVLSTSFSRNGDLLSQWRSYTPSEGGFSIGFKRDSLEVPYKSDESYIKIYDCEYTDKEKNRLADLFGRKVILDHNRLKHFDTNLRQTFESTIYYFLMLIMSSKNENFAEEQEVRHTTYIHKDLIEVDIEKMSHAKHALAYYPNGNKLYSKKNIKFRSKSNLLIPYVEQSFDITSIKEIIIGPTSDVEITKKSLEFFIKNLGLEIEVKSSSIPYRTF